MHYFMLQTTQVISHFTTNVPQLVALTAEQFPRHNDEKQTPYSIDEMCDYLPRSIVAVQLASSLYHADDCFTTNYDTPAFEPVDGLLHYPDDSKAAYLSEPAAKALIASGVTLNTFSVAKSEYDIDLNVYHYLSVEDIQSAGLISKNEAKILWSKLGDTPVDEDGCLEEPFLSFEEGTDRETIWAWFETIFDIPVHSLMYPNSTEPPLPLSEKTTFPISQGRIFFSNDESYLLGVKNGAEYANDGAFDIGLVEKSVLPQYAFMLAIGDSDDDDLFGDFDDQGLIELN